MAYGGWVYLRAGEARSPDIVNRGELVKYGHQVSRADRSMQHKGCLVQTTHIPSLPPGRLVLSVSVVVVGNILYNSTVLEEFFFVSDEEVTA